VVTERFLVFQVFELGPLQANRVEISIQVHELGFRRFTFWHEILPFQ
jgi:hypothetical protein